MSRRKKIDTPASDRNLSDEIRSISREQKSRSRRESARKQLKAFVKTDYYDVALAQFGQDILDRAALVLVKARRESEKRRLARIEKIRAQERAKGLSESQIARMHLQSVRRPKLPDLHYARVWPKKKGRAYYEYRLVRVKGKHKRIITRYFKTGQGLSRAQKAVKRRESRARLAATLGLSLKDARKVELDVMARAKKALRDFKSSRAYKSRDARWQRGITEKRFRGAALISLYELTNTLYES